MSIRHDFASNPNGKLFLDHFGDICGSWVHYQIDEVVEIYLKGQLMGSARVVAMNDFRYNQVRDAFSFLNCGRHAAHQCRLIKRDFTPDVPNAEINPGMKLVHIIFKYKERNMPVFTEMMDMWWSEINESNPTKPDTEA